MEISRIINDLEEFNQISSDNELNLILEELSEFSPEDFIYIDYVGNSKNLDMMELFRKLVNRIDVEINEGSIKKKVAIIKSLIPIFQKGLNEINLVYFFIFLYANSRIKMPIYELVRKYDLNDKFDKILVLIFEILDNYKIRAVDKALSRYFDKIRVRNEEETLIASLKQIDFEKDSYLLKFGKYSLPIHFYQMIDVLQEHNLELFEKLLTSDNVYTLILIIKCMSFNQIDLFSINHNKIKEKTLLCFLMKFLNVASKSRKNSYYDVILDLSIRLYQLNNTLFKGLMDIFAHDEFFNEIMGSMFCKLPKEDINVLVDLIQLSNNVKYIDVRSKMLDKCMECENFKYILKLIYEKWRFHLSNFSNYEKIALNILCTDFCNFIVAYYFYQYDIENLLNSMKDLFIILKNLDSEWSKDIIHHKNKFFVYYSELFIISVIYDYNNLDDDEVKELYNEFYEEYFLFKKFLDDEKENFLDKFEDNLLTKS